jgi:hypothetical protein
MSEAQYFAIGLPVFAFLLNIALGVVQTNSLQARITSVETGVNSRLSDFTLTGKVVEIDNRLTRVEERLLHS